MKKLLILLMLGAAACSTPKSENASTTPNQLTEAQKAEGWKLLFDGQTMNGWRSFKNKENNTWEVLDGTLHCKSSNDTTATQRADIMTTEMYGNFELSFDFKIAPEGNSGLIYRVTEEFDVPYASGPEYQIIDDIGYPGELKDVNKTAANYDVHVAENKKLNPAGEWNTGKLVINGNHVEHWLNGAKVVEYEFASDDWKAKVAASKWKDYPGYGQSASGYIDLQDHGSEVWFRNIMVKPL